MSCYKGFATLAVLLQLYGSAGAEDSPRIAINPRAEIVADTQLRIDASPEVVWAVLTDVARWNEWLPEFANARLDGPLEAGTTLFWEPQGQRVVSRLVVVDPPRRLIWNGSGGAVHVWELTPSGTGTLLRNAESIEHWDFPGATSDQNAFLAQTLTIWNERLAERVGNRQ